MGPEATHSNGAERPGEGGKAGPPPSSKGGTLPIPPETPVSANPARSAPPMSSPEGSRPALGRHPAARHPDRALQDLWVDRLRHGDAEALREVVQAFGERLTSVVAGILRDHDAVEDVVQETFTKAYYRIHAFHGGSSLYTWLYRVAVNAAKDYIKSRKRRPASSLDELATRATLPTAERPPLEGLERRELRLRVHAAIDCLPHRFRTVLALREIEGMAYNEIAEVLGLSLGTVESRLFRARKRLRALLAPPSPGPSLPPIGQDP